jgi:hypothetical protein|tara:strand:+ start:927 stop:1202 length:276 start_codon:yes stop_codon:yes gene_type:complete
LTNIVHANFGGRLWDGQFFNADVYTENRTKYQFEATAESATAAYFRIIALAVKEGISVIRLVAMFDGVLADRKADHPPIKVWSRPKIASGL